MTEQEAIKAIENDLKWHSKELKPKYKEVLKLAINALETVYKIESIIKIEQQPTSCEHTKLKSFETIENIIVDYQISKHH